MDLTFKYLVYLSCPTHYNTIYLYTCAKKCHTHSFFGSMPFVCTTFFRYLSISPICFGIQSTKYETCTEGIFPITMTTLLRCCDLMWILYKCIVCTYICLVGECVSAQPILCESSFVWMISMAMWKTMLYIYRWKHNLQCIAIVYYNNSNNNTIGWRTVHS